MSFIWSTQETEYLASEVTTVTGLELSPAFIDQTVQDSFRLGNTGSSTSNYSISASGLNSNVTDDVEFSVDLINWYETITISGIQPNQMTDKCYYRFTPDEDNYEGEGSFLIRVDEESV